MHKEYRLFYWLLGGATFVCGLLWVGTLLFHGSNEYGYEMNLFTEATGVLVSIGFTVLVVDRLYERRDAEQLKKRLVREAGSRLRGIAIPAVEWLRAEGWLTGDDGLLKAADLWEANLEGAVLWKANLQQAVLHRAKLQRSNLNETTLRGAELNGARLEGSMLWMADLQGAYIVDANVEGATFHSATLPDGTTWSEDEDLGRFVDPSHAKYKTTLTKINAIRQELQMPIIHRTDEND